MEQSLGEERPCLQKLGQESWELMSQIGYHLEPQEVVQLTGVCHFFATLFHANAPLWSHFKDQLMIGAYSPCEGLSPRDEVKYHLLRSAVFAESKGEKAQSLIQKYQLNKGYKPFLRIDFARGMTLITIFPLAAHCYLAGYGEPNRVVPLPKNYNFGSDQNKELMGDSDPRVRDQAEYSKYSGLLNGMYGYKKNPQKAQNYYEKRIDNGNQNFINLKIVRAGVDSVIGVVNNPKAVKEVIKGLDGEKNYLVGAIYKALGLKYGILGFPLKPEKAARFIKKTSLSY